MFPQWTIYRPTREFPDRFVIREWACSVNGPVQTGTWSIHGTLEAARDAVPDGYEPVPRAPDDDPSIVEVWVPLGWGEAIAKATAQGEAGVERMLETMRRAIRIEPTEVIRTRS